MWPFRKKQMYTDKNYRHLWRCYCEQYEIIEMAHSFLMEDKPDQAKQALYAWIEFEKNILKDTYHG